jgi:Effector-associated domain 1
MLDAVELQSSATGSALKGGERMGTAIITRFLDWLLQPPVTDEELIDELARVLVDPDEARLVVERAGFSAGRIPAFHSTPHVFWTAVVRAARHGAIKGRVQALAEAAAERYPGNEIFSRYKSS